MGRASSAGRSIEWRRGTSPEPLPIRLAGEDDLNETVRRPSQLFMRAPSRVTPHSRIDIHADASVPLDVAVRCDEDQECYGRNNWSFWSKPPWRNPEWRLEKAG